MPGTYIPNQTDSDVALSRSCDHGKITKGLKDSGVTDDGQGASGSPGKLNVKTGPPFSLHFDV